MATSSTRRAVPVVALLAGASLLVAGVSGPSGASPRTTPPTTATATPSQAPDGAGDHVSDTTPADTEPAPGATPVPGRPVLDPLDPQAPRPAPAVLAGLLAPLARQPALGREVTYDVVDVATGAHLAASGPAVPQVPASTVKLLVAAAALTDLDPGRGLTTRAVTGATAGEVVLVGGGDVLLSTTGGEPTAVNGQAGLATLAARTAAALAARGVTAVTVRVDDTLFSGPRVQNQADVAAGFVAPVTSLAVDLGRLGTRRSGSGEYAPRQGAPAVEAGRAFGRLLASRGLEVGEVTAGRAPAGAQPLAEVTGAPLGDVVELMLTTSDNTLAEVLTRLVARAQGRPGTAADGGAAVLRTVAGLGVPTAGARLSGGSGLGRTDVVPASALTAVLGLAASADHPELRPVLTGLPVAAVSGTLADRFGAAGQVVARGAVRAKTGSLSGVNSLAGVVLDADGRLLAFAVLADRTAGTDAARAALDRFGATLAACGCG